MVTFDAKALVARGNTSDVYRWGADTVLKLLRPGIPDEWARIEAHITSLVHAAGLPAPAVFDLVTIDGRRGIVFGRIEGKSMWAQMLATPGDIGRLSRMLAELQAEVNATPAPSGMPRLEDRLLEKIDGAERLSPSERNAARDDLRRVEGGDALCHFDVHPNNVLMAADQPVIIDWYDAAAGTPAADIARASALMRQDAADGHLPCLDRSIITLVHDAYVASVARRSEIDAAEVSRWESPVLAARLAEPLPDAALSATYTMWCAARESQPTDLAARLSSETRPRRESVA